MGGRVDTYFLHSYNKTCGARRKKNRIGCATSNTIYYTYVYVGIS